MCTSFIEASLRGIGTPMQDMNTTPPLAGNATDTKIQDVARRELEVNTLKNYFLKVHKINPERLKNLGGAKLQYVALRERGLSPEAAILAIDRHLFPEGHGEGHGRFLKQVIGTEGFRAEELARSPTIAQIKAQRAKNEYYELVNEEHWPPANASERTGYYPGGQSQSRYDHGPGSPDPHDHTYPCMRPPITSERDGRNRADPEMYSTPQSDSDEINSTNSDSAQGFELGRWAKYEGPIRDYQRHMDQCKEHFKDAYGHAKQAGNEFGHGSWGDAFETAGVSVGDLAQSAAEGSAGVGIGAWTGAQVTAETIADIAAAFAQAVDSEIVQKELP
jgi:hypothetical protein